MTRSSPVPSLRAPLADGVVVVRLRQPSDVDPIARASHDPESLRWLDDPPMDDEARRTAMDRAEDAWRSGRAAPLVIADAGTDEPVGIINLQFRSDDVAAVAYSVFPDRRGSGIAPRAVELVANWGFRELGLVQLLLEADEGNVASRRVAEKCGFRQLDRRTEPGVDDASLTTVVYARAGAVLPS